MKVCHEYAPNLGKLVKKIGHLHDDKFTSKAFFVQHSTFPHCWQWYVAQYTRNSLISLHCNNSYMKHATMLRYMHTAYLVSVFQAVSKPQFLRALLYSLIHSLCGPAHGIQTTGFIQYVVRALQTTRCDCVHTAQVHVQGYVTQNSWLCIILPHFPTHTSHKCYKKTL